MDAASLWLRPVGLLRGSAAEAAVETGSALPLAGGPSAFALVEALALRDGMLVAATSTPAALHGWAPAQGAAMAARVAGQLAPPPAQRPARAGLARASLWTGAWPGGGRRRSPGGGGSSPMSRPCEGTRRAGAPSRGPAPRWC